MILKKLYIHNYTDFFVFFNFLILYIYIKIKQYNIYSRFIMKIVYLNKNK